MSIAAHLVRIGNHVLNLIAGILIFTMLLYGGYSIWDTIMIYKGAFISEDLLQYKPSKTESAGVSLADLLKINPEVRGWITMDGTHVDYPVLQVYPESKSYHHCPFPACYSPQSWRGSRSHSPSQSK